MSASKRSAVRKTRTKTLRGKGATKAGKSPTRSLKPSRSRDPKNVANSSPAPSKALSSRKAATKTVKSKKPSPQGAVNSPPKSSAAGRRVRAIAETAKPIAGTSKRRRPARSVFYQQSDGWTTIDVQDGVAVHDSQFAKVHYLNHTAAAVFLLCKEPISVELISTIMREEFKLKASPKKSVQSVNGEMLKSGLLTEIA